MKIVKEAVTRFNEAMKPSALKTVPGCVVNTRPMLLGFVDKVSYAVGDNTL